MTVKFLGMQDISIRPQNDTEKILIDNLKNLIAGGKKINLVQSDNGDDLVFSIRSKGEN